MDQLSIREILDSVYRGQIRIPAFQRGFVWEPDRVAFLIDSIYKQYPFGSLLFWRTNEQLRTERQLGPFELPNPDSDFPIDYVLDGQQRITSIFGVFQTELGQIEDENWKEIYFDFSQNEDVQETQFFALGEDEVDSERHFPLRSIFNTTEYRKLTRKMSDELAERIDSMQSVFKEAKIPYQSFRTDEKEKVAIIFERINRQGVPLDTLQLLSAWTWSEEFQLQGQFEDLVEELQSYGFSDISNDISLLLRCTAAVLTETAKPESLVGLNGAVVRDRFSEVLNGIKGALDFLKSELNVETIENLPYQVILVPLSVFFAVPGNSEFAYTDAQRKKIVTWFWRVSYSKRYSAGLLRNLNTDIKELVRLKKNKESKIDDISVSISDSFFTKNRFLISSVNTKAFIMLLSQGRPLNFINGTPVDLANKLRDCNRKEFHHLMPKAFLSKSNQEEVYHPSCLANFCFISRAGNRVLGGERPSIYKSKIVGDINKILDSHSCPYSLLDDDFESFAEARARVLAQRARELCSV
ncbi:DUF262 domain-containing protein [Vreelandella aquamarina]|uniref:GmrSD restriction endonuclease domain-containing protein n=1 Tax=Vreelandella aquamarina TaxID=77097 RepID=UPI0038508FC1